MQGWSDVETVLMEEAAHDLAARRAVRPCMLAFAGDELLFVAFLRGFEQGEYADPMIELLSLAMPLDADRLAVSFGARAWSLADPVPPVLRGVGDLRQRVLSVERADASRGAVRSVSTMIPFELTGGTVDWGEPIHDDGGAIGWISSALALAVRGRRDLAAPVAVIRGQAERCVALGHELALTAATSARLGTAALSGDPARFSAPCRRSPRGARRAGRRG